VNGPAHLDEILYPAIEPYETGYPRRRRPARVLGAVRQPRRQAGRVPARGPGGGTSPWHRRFFDPEKYRIVLFDQRGCGKSTPHMSEPDADPATTRHGTSSPTSSFSGKNLGIDRWQVFGGSWGLPSPWPTPSATRTP
jgi:proline iminopeptidase